MSLALETAKNAAQQAQISNKDIVRFPAWPEIKHLLDFPSLSTKSDMFARVLCFPALGEAFVVPAGQNKVLFSVILEADVNSDKRWQVELWHGAPSGEWQSTAMNYDGEDRPGEEEMLSVAELTVAPKRHLFSLELARPMYEQTETQFTIKFRDQLSTKWKWMKDQFKVSDGSLYWQQDSKPSRDFHYYITGTSPSVAVKTAPPQTSDTLLWQLTCAIGPAKGDKSCFAHYNLGLATNFTRWFATCRLMTTWIRPKHGQDKFFIDQDKAVSVAFLRHDGLSVVALALSGIDDTSVLFQEDEAGNVVIAARNDSESHGEARVIVAVANSFEVANAAVMYHARMLSSDAQSQVASKEDEIVEATHHDVDAQWMEEWYDGFGYCTWNSLGQQLTEKSILAALEQFQRDGISLTSLIIDDNWQSLDNEGQNQGMRGMTRFEADEVAFPRGLQDLISKVKESNHSIKRVAVWHTMLGYWGAISPSGEIATNYKTVQALNNNGWNWTCIAGDDVARFYDDFFKFLVECGVDGVKTDSQNSLDDLQNATNRRSMIKEYQDAWVIAGLRHLGARQISCGSQCPVIMFHSMIKTNTPRLVVRNSDDFFPLNAGSHAWHIFCNAHNSLFMQHLHVLPDWDMFQTDHEWASYHAAARCISGGPIYITDYPSKHDKSLISQMTAKTTNGNTVILRPSRLAKASKIYNSYSEPKLLRVDTYNGPARTGTSIVGVFNVSQAILSELVSLTDFPGTEEGQYIIRSHTMGLTSRAIDRLSKHSIIHVELGIKGYDVLTAYPVRVLRTSNRSVAVANLGLIGKMSGAAAILSEQIYSSSAGTAGNSEHLPLRARIWTSLKALGTWAVWIENMQSYSIANDMIALVSGKPIDLQCVKISALDKNVLEIDLVKAWEMSNNRSTWGNEVAVELLIR